MSNYSELQYLGGGIYAGASTSAQPESLSDLVASVVTLTNRPDLTELATIAVLKATIKEHAAVDYPRDLITMAPFPLDNTSGIFRYTFNEDDYALAGVIRRIAAIREYFASPASAIQTFSGYWGEIEFKERAGTDLFDNYNAEFLNYFYRQGGLISLVAARQVDSIGIQFYKHPNTSRAQYKSWIADLYPHVIYEAAAANVFQAIGKNDEAATYRAKLPDNRLDVIKSEIGAI